MASFELASIRTLKNEGGYVNNPADRGGETKYGITKKYHPNLDIKNLTWDQAKAIYKKEYWDPIDGDQIKNQKVAEAIFDHVINASLVGAKSYAKKALSIIGQPNLDYKNIPDSLSDAFNNAFGNLRLAFYRELAKKPGQAQFLKSWERRTKEFFREVPKQKKALGLGTLLIATGLGLWLYKRNKKRA